MSRVVVAASLQAVCVVCGGDGHTWIRPVDGGTWARIRCPHCCRGGIPYFPLPMRQDEGDQRERAPRP